MVSGRLRLQREYFARRENDVTVLFRDDPAMHMVNIILKRCVVEHAEQCETTASELASIVGAYIQILENGGQLLRADIPRPCRVCGYGHYRREHGAESISPSSGGLCMRLPWQHLPFDPYRGESERLWPRRRSALKRVLRDLLRLARGLWFSWLLFWVDDREKARGCPIQELLIMVVTPRESMLQAIPERLFETWQSISIVAFL
jgi:hypothetical protein